MKHHELCAIGAKWLKKNGIGWDKPKIIVVEIELAGFPQPDIYAFGGCPSIQIEIKMSRGDFTADRKKRHLQDVGQRRYYLCPVGLIDIYDNYLTDGWGLLYYHEDGKIELIKESDHFLGNVRNETAIIASVMRREGFYNRIFSYKKYNKNEKDSNQDTKIQRDRV